MKTKVVAFRVTQEEYDALAFVAQLTGKKLGTYVDDALLPTIQAALVHLRKERKRVDAKIKRDAKKATVESPVMRNQRIKRERKAGHLNGVQ